MKILYEKGDVVLVKSAPDHPDYVPAMEEYVGKYAVVEDIDFDTDLSMSTDGLLYFLNIDNREFYWYTEMLEPAK